VSVSGISNSDPYVVTWGTAIANFDPSPSSVLVFHSGTNFCTFHADSNDTQNVITAIKLPNGQSYSFSYDSGSSGFHSGLPSEIVYPSGGWVKYVWGLAQEPNQYATLPDDADKPFACDWEYSAPVVLQRSVSFDGTNVALIQIFNYSTTWSSTL